MRICKAQRRRSFTIPNELVEEILSRLPVKSLMRFKCVSKAWHTLISSHRFAKSHSQRASQNPNRMNVLVLTDNCVLSAGCEALFQSRAIHGQPVDVDFPGFPLWGEKHVETNLASCNSLVCIELHNVDKWTAQYLVWNPSTKSYKNIPSPTSTPDSYWFGGFGFGYDYSTDDYKILRPYDIDIHVSTIEIFSLKTFTWKTILVDMDNNFFIRSSIQNIKKTIYCNGAIYLSYKYFWKPPIIYFDLADEIFHELSWPESVSYYDTSKTWELGTFGEHLCLSVCTGESRNALCIQLWVMKESWTRLATIPYRGTCPRPICVSKNGEKILLREKQVGKNSEYIFKLIVINLKKKAYRKTRYDSKTIMEATTYVESLYSLDCNDGLNQHFQEEGSKGHKGNQEVCPKGYGDNYFQGGC
ncbi:F-box/kelch-repeat protein At3g23880-like [Quercus robur]|uniref:F-box/kelch-repeat protein At3g23880-like n=1 Tax=Quercus robur TaxID=38942 RepID=UPI0021618228|nr:F-box/kelch-repeat protein At3g23880-like [Quercus robur]